MSNLHKVESLRIDFHFHEVEFGFKLFQVCRVDFMVDFIKYVGNKHSLEIFFYLIKLLNFGVQFFLHDQFICFHFLIHLISPQSHFVWKLWIAFEKGVGRFVIGSYWLFEASHFGQVRYCIWWTLIYHLKIVRRWKGNHWNIQNKKEDENSWT